LYPLTFQAVSKILYPFVFTIKKLDNSKIALRYTFI